MFTRSKQDAKKSRKLGRNVHVQSCPDEIATKEARPQPCPNKIADELLRRSHIFMVLFPSRPDGSKLCLGKLCRSPISSLFCILIRFRV
jgi:hypothetical protein